MSIALMTMAWRLALPSPRKMVLLALADAANDQGECFPSIATLVDKCSMSERALQGHITALEKAGFLSRVVRTGRSSVYQLHPRRICTPAESAPPQNLHPTPADSAPTPAESAPPNPAESAPLTVIEPSSEPSGEPPPTPASKKPSMRGGVSANDAEASFSAFWTSWPAKRARVSALIAWRRIRPNAALLAVIIAALERQKASDEWLREGGRFIPHAATWLNGRRWEDEVRTSYAADEADVMVAYNRALGDRGWPRAADAPFSEDRAAAIRAFLGFGSRDGWVDAYFSWLAEKLSPLEGFGFDWAIQRSTYLRAKEGNFSALREAA